MTWKWMGRVSVLAGLGGCAQQEPTPERTMTTEAECLAALSDIPRAELRTRGGVAVRDGLEVGYSWAPQGGMYTPYVLSVWGRPELYEESEYPDLGQVWARYGQVDLDSGEVLLEHDYTGLLICAGGDGESHLEFVFDAEYFDYADDYGYEYKYGVPLHKDELEGRWLALSVALAPLPDPGEPAPWGYTYPNGPKTFPVDLTFEVVLTSGVPL